MLPITIVGDESVGKTSLLRSLPNKKITSKFELFIGSMFQNTVNIQDDISNCRATFYETLSFDQYRDLTLTHTKPDAIIVMFSIEISDSSNNVEDFWMSRIHYYFPNIPILLVGNKIDLRGDSESLLLYLTNEKKLITAKMGEELASKINAVKYMECSCKTGAGVSDVIHESVQVAKKQVIEQAIAQPRTLIAKLFHEPKKDKIMKTCLTIATHNDDVVDPPVVHKLKAK